jgi:ABC-2 type transport system ATP-binding protein
LISCRNLTRRFGDFTAVDNLSIEIAPGSICAFLGPNGAGKSTTVNMLTGLLAPTSGEATVAGVPVTSGVELQKRIGVLPASLALFDELTVQEHLVLTGDVYGLSRTETQHRARQLLQVLDLDHGRNVFAIRCSSGMRKKTALAMALIHNPPVLFLDEPFEAVDPMTSRSIAALLEQAAARGTTVFLTSHILATVEKLAQRFVVFRKGRIAWDSGRDELTRPLEEIYFDLIEAPPPEGLEWLGSDRS